MIEFAAGVCTVIWGGGVTPFLLTMKNKIINRNVRIKDNTWKVFLGWKIKIGKFFLLLFSRPERTYE